MRILIVDDDRASRVLLERIVEEEGFTVAATECAEEALELLAREPFHLVITDWNLPGMPGPEFCERIRIRHPEGHIYIILLTARNINDDVVVGLDAGADDFIRKPFDRAELRVRIRAGQRVVNLQTRDIAIFALARLAESRDPETGAHLERIRSYCRALAEYCVEQRTYGPGMDHRFVKLIYETSPLHDIGKVGVPDSILLKPGRLTDREFEIMKSHTVIGADTLRAAADKYPSMPFLTMACDIARSHHERWDGSGYPDALRAEQIPLAARMLAVADVYDALTSERFYKDAFSHDAAVGIIREGRATHFDPELVDAFLMLERDFNAIRRALDDAAQIAGSKPATTPA